MKPITSEVIPQSEATFLRGEIDAAQVRPSQRASFTARSSEERKLKCMFSALSKHKDGPLNRPERFSSLPRHIQLNNMNKSLRISVVWGRMLFQYILLLREAELIYPLGLC